MTDAAPNSWQPKDFLISLPAIASSLAISWEVGRLTPFGGFQFFSLSEHLVSALKALPIALSATFMLAASFVGLNHITRRYRPKRPFIIFLGTCATTVISCALYWKFRSRDLSPIAIDVAVLLFVANAFWLRISFASFVGQLIIFGAAIGLSMLLAAELSFSLIEKAKSDRSVLSSITFKSGATKDGLVLMIGEQGVLYYDPVTERVEFDRLEDVKSFAWPR